MVSEEKTEWPTAQKLEQLRAQGIVPHSHAGALLLVTAAMAVGLWASQDQFAQWWTALQGLIATATEQGAHAFSIERLKSVHADLVLTALVPVLIATVCVVLAGLLQTRFTLRLGAVAIEGSRLFAWTGLRGAFGRMCSMAGSALAWLALCLALGLLIVPIVSGLLRLDSHATQQLPELLLRTVAFLAGPVGLALAIIAIVGSQLEFRRRNRMTRKEREAEGRE